MPNAPRLLPFLLITYVFGPQSAFAVVDVQGDAASVRVVARQAQVSEVLSALGKTVGIRFDIRANLDNAIDATYTGSVEGVLARVLRGYDYVIATREGRLEVIVVSRASAIAVEPTPSQTLPKNTDPAAQWRANLPEAKKP